MSQNNNNKNNEDLGFLREMIDAVKADIPEESDYLTARHNLIKKIKSENKENFIMKIIRNLSYGRVRWATIGGLTIIVFIAIALFSQFGKSTGQAYASVVEQIKNAVTLSFRIELYLDANQPPMKTRMTLHDPGIQRIEADENDSFFIQVIDTTKKKGIIIYPMDKSYMDMDVNDMNNVDRDRIEMASLLTKELRTLPEKADEILESEIVNGREIKRFRSSKIIIGIDTQISEIAYVEILGTAKIVLSDFKINPEIPDENYFSIIPPEGYRRIIKSPLKYKTKPQEDDLVKYLETIAKMTKGDLFPNGINPMEMMTRLKQGMLKDKELGGFSMNKDETKAFAEACQKAVIFVMIMKPENDWHYAGEGVKLGETETPIAWWKPEDSDNYRVIWGDMRITDSTIEDISNALEKLK